MSEDEKKVLELAHKWYAESGLKFTDELWFAVGQLCERERIRPTKRTADLAVCTCSTMLTMNTLQIEPACPKHSPSR